MRFLILLFSTLFAIHCAFSQVIVGAARFNQYLPLLKNKNVGVVVNHTSVVDDVHLVDCLIEKGVKVKKIFAPEHGFRGKADAGEIIESGQDASTGLPVISLYGENKKPTKEQVSDLDVLIFDIQDVGARFYTYISTMHYIMEACAENDKKCIVLDRPNPNGHYIDGPVLNMNLQSFVGMHPIPIVHGLTVGELATMINGEGWLKGNRKCDLEVIKCENYTHTTSYTLPIKPSPNLPNMKSIYLYPSLCLVEGTSVSCGRGTDKQFQVMGHPDYNPQEFSFAFTPMPNEGSKHPKHEGKKCYGIDLSTESEKDLMLKKFTLQYLVDMYQKFPDKDDFFLDNNLFEKLAGNDKLRNQIKENIPITEIRESWEPQLSEYKKMRKSYLLYPDFE